MFVPPFLCPHIPLRVHGFTAMPLPFPPSCPMAPGTNGDKAHIQLSHRPHPSSQSLAFNLTRNPNPLISLPIHPQFLSSLLSLLHLSYMVCHFSKTLGSKLNLPFLIFRYFVVTPPGKMSALEKANHQSSLICTSLLDDPTRKMGERALL